MEIRGPEMTPGKNIENRGQFPEQALRTGQANQESGNTSAPRAAAFYGEPSDIPPQELHALKAELARAGVNISEIDSSALLRAYLLHKHGVPLIAQAVMEYPDGDTPFAGRVADLLSAIRSLVSEGRLNEEALAVVRTLEAGLSSVTGATEAQNTIRFLVEQTIDSWAHALETVIRAVASGDEDALFPAAGGTLFSSEIEMLQHPLTQDSSGRLGELIRMIREAVDTYRGRVTAAVGNGAAGVNEAADAAETLAARLSALYSDSGLTMLSGGDRPLPAALLAGLVDTRFRALDQRIRILIETAMVKNGDDGVSLPGFAETVRKSGMMFEWRLLAWYRSGRNPESLRSLFGDDLKGVAKRFLADLGRLRRGERLSRGMESLERRANSLDEAITGRQLSTVLNRVAEKRGGIIEFFPGGIVGEQDSVVVRRKRSGGESGNPAADMHTMTFSVETSRLGTVAVTMHVSGKLIDCAFMLESADARSTGEAMAGEIAGSLEARGFTVRSIRFEPPKSARDSQQTVTGERHMNGVDIRK